MPNLLTVEALGNTPTFDFTHEHPAMLNVPHLKSEFLDKLTSPS